MSASKFFSHPWSRLGGVVLALVLLLGTSGCSEQIVGKEATEGLVNDPYPKAPAHLAPSLRILVWPDTITPEAKASFESRYGVKLVIDTFHNDNDAYRHLTKNPDKWGVIMVSQHMGNRMRQEGMFQPVPRLNPYIYQYINTASVDPDADPQMKYFIPFDYATLGITFNIDQVGGLPRKWEFLSEHADNPYLYGRIVINDDMRYAMAVALLYSGLDPNTSNPRDIAVARDLLIDSVHNIGLRFLSDAQIREEMASQDALVGITWSGEAAAILLLRPSCRFLVPEGPSIVTSDGFGIPLGAPDVDTAALFIEYMLHPYVSLQAANACMYASVNIRSMKHADRFLINGPSTIFPSRANRLHMKYFQGHDLKLYQDAWAEVRKAKIDESRVIPIPVQ